MTIDIKAVQAEAASKAAQWITTEAPVTEQAAPVAVPAPAPVPDPATTAPAQQPAQRWFRGNTVPDTLVARMNAAAAQAQTEASKYRGELEQLRKENEALKSLGAATDPFEFLKGRKLSKDQQALWGQAFLYDLKPEVAPQEFRLELYKAEQARKEAERIETANREEAEQAEAQTRAHFERYAGELHTHVQSSAGSNPESEMWFTEDGPDGQPTLNHGAYAQSLLATAKNLANSAARQGQQADLSPANIARVLEAEVSKRMARRDAKRTSAVQPAKAVEPAKPAPGGTQPTITASDTGLRGGTPTQPAQTPDERRARAAAAMYSAK